MPEPSADTPQLSLRDRLERIFHKPVTRREVVAAGAGAGLSLIAAGVVGVPKFLQVEASLEASRNETAEAIAVSDEAKSQTEKAQGRFQKAQEETEALQKDLEKVSLSEGRARIETEMQKVQNANSEKERLALLEEISRLFAKDYDQNISVSNNFVDTYNSIQAEKRQPRNFTESNALRWAFERSGLILERGVALVSAWQKLEGVKESAGFDKEGRLIFEGRKLHINENVCDWHIALNLIRAKINEKSNDDSIMQAKSAEDLRDLLQFVDIRPSVDIEKTAWAVMPPDWATTLARFTIFLNEKNIPPPQEYNVRLSYTLHGQNFQGGYYQTGSGGRFPQETQVIYMGSSLSAPVIFHEGGHYIADAAKITGRLLGGERRIPFPDIQRDYDRMLGRLQKSIFQSALKSGAKPGDWTKTFVTPYASTNSVEDFAETYAEFMYYGPAFKERIERLRKEDPASASLLEAKYDFMKANIARGFEYGIEGRKKSTPLNSSDKLLVSERIKEGARLSESFNYEKKYLSEQWKKPPAFEHVEASLVVPTSEPVLDLALLETKVWEDIVGFTKGEIVDVSYIAFVPHREFIGRADISVKLKNGEVGRINLDTQNQQNVQNLLKLLPQADIDTREVVANSPEKFSQESLDYFKSQGIKPPKLAYSGFWSPTYPPYHVDRSDMFFARFQYTNGEWRQKTLDVRRTNLFIKEMREGKENIRRSNYFTVTLGEKDLILGIDRDGNLREVRTHNI